MKTTTVMDEIRNMGEQELTLLERNTAEQIWKLRFQQHTGQLTNTAGLVDARKKLARIKTIRIERSRGIVASAAEG